MRLEPGASARCTGTRRRSGPTCWTAAPGSRAVDQDGRNFVDDVGEGDLWFFPAGIPHSIQGLRVDGCEFLLVFDDGGFSENSTFLITDWFAHTPRDVLAKNFGVAGDVAEPAQARSSTSSPAPVPGRPPADRMAGRRRHVPQSSATGCSPQAADRRQGGRVRDRRLDELPRREDDRGGAGRDRARRHAGAALAPERRRMAVLHRGRGADDRLRARSRRPAPSTTGRATSATCPSRWATTSRTPATSRCGSWRCSAAPSSRILAQPVDGADAPPLVRAHLKIDEALLAGLPVAKTPVLPG